MPVLKPWFHVVQPREDLREGKPLDASEFAVHLDHVRQGRAPDDYRVPERFFDRTYLTHTLRDLAAQVVRRLSGERVETSAVFNMATQFGGGKTHALTLLYHLAQAGPKANEWTGVQRILSDARVASVPKADTAVFVGTEFDAITGRGGSDDTPLRRTPWGEIAWQLARDVGFAAVARHDEIGQAPAGDVIRQMLPEGPTLILMDELMNYVSRTRKSGLAAQLYNFLQNLGEEARARSNMVLAVSIPASELEMNADDQRDYESLKKLLDRLGKPIVMSAETETVEIIRRRLFEWQGLPTDGVKTAGAYAEWAVEHQQMLSEVDVATVRDRFRDSYPFHPALLSVFERKWQTLPRFQRTRGVLRLLALWVSQAYEAGYRGAHKDPLIGLGTAPLEDPYFRAAMFEQLGSDQLEAPVTTDIAGSQDAHAVRLDREATAEIRKARLHQKVATTILFESNGGMTKAEATQPEIRFSVSEPGFDIANIEPVLEELVESSYYLSSERNRYRYSLAPNLNKLLTDRRATIQAGAVEQRVREEVQAVFKEKGAGLDRYFFPEKSSQIPNRPALSLIVLLPEQAWSDPHTPTLIQGFLREYGTSGRTFKSALLFAVPDASPFLQDEARKLLAWEDVANDTETCKRLEDPQLDQLHAGAKKAVRDVREAVWRTYKHVVLLGRDNELKEIDLGLVHSSMAGSISDLILNRLQQDDEITTGVGPSKLVRYWPPSVTAWSTKAARDAFFSSPALPRLLDPNAIKRTIVDGVAQKVLAYARKDGAEGFDPLYFGTTLSEADIEISDEMFLLTADEAKKYIEPPKLSRLEVAPASVRCHPAETVRFTAKGFDQHGRPFSVDSVTWRADAGRVDDAGCFTAMESPGPARVYAEAGELEATAAVLVVTKDEPVPPPPPNAALGISWRGEIPTQKWMNFYTKVLTRFAGASNLRIKVEFEVPAGPNVTDAKRQETRVALRELGLEEKLDGD